METSKTRLTADEYFALPETSEPTELLDGELVVSPPPTPYHQDIVGNLYEMLRERKKVRGGKVYMSPIGLFLDESNAPEPDVLWLSPDSKCIVGPKYLIGAPDLIAEILSPATFRHDRRNKFRLYERHKVAEYWIVDPAHMHIEPWQLVNGLYQLTDIFGLGDSFESPQMGTIEVDAIFKSQ